MDGLRLDGGTAMRKGGGIDNVRKWYRATRPTEHQIDDIDGGLAFSWLVSWLVGDQPSVDAVGRAVCNLDTMVRDAIFHEALVRALLALRSEGRTDDEMAGFLQDAAGRCGYTDYGIRSALSDAGLESK